MGDLLSQAHWASYALGLGERVRAVRLMRGLSQLRLAEMAGVSRSLISNIERNDYNGARAADPTISTLYRLASALKVPPAALLPGALEEVVGHFEARTAVDHSGAEGEEPLPANEYAWLQTGRSIEISLHPAAHEE